MAARESKLWRELDRGLVDRRRELAALEPKIGDREGAAPGDFIFREREADAPVHQPLNGRNPLRARRERR